MTPLPPAGAGAQWVRAAPPPPQEGALWPVGTSWRRRRPSLLLLLLGLMQAAAVRTRSLAVRESSFSGMGPTSMQTEVVKSLGEVRHVGRRPSLPALQASLDPVGSELELLGQRQHQGPQRGEIALQRFAGHLQHCSPVRPGMTRGALTGLLQGVSWQGRQLVVQSSGAEAAQQPAGRAWLQHRGADPAALRPCLDKVFVQCHTNNVVVILLLEHTPARNVIQW